MDRLVNDIDMPLIQLRGDSQDNDISVPSLLDTVHRVYAGGGNDTLIALGDGSGLDEFYGEGGNDYLQAGNIDAGRNYLSGGAGADTMVGAVGSDLFEVLNRGDVVQDGTAGDRDWVSVYTRSYKLPANVENLERLGDGDFTGRGNSLANHMTAGYGNDVLYGLAGDDTLEGGALYARTTLVGGAGADLLLNRSRSDAQVTTFRYDRTADSNRLHGEDRINWLGANDFIDLSRIDASAATVDTNDTFVFIGSNAFGPDATGQVRYEQVSDKQIVVLVSTDADPAAEMRIILVSSPPPTETNFIL